MSKRITLRRSACSLLAAISMGGLSAQAATFTWSGATSDWGTGTNWTPGGPPAAPDTASFTGGGVLGVNLAAPQTINTLSIGGASNGYDIDGSTLTVTNITQAAPGLTSIGSQIISTGTTNVAGGILYLYNGATGAGANNFTGGTVNVGPLGQLISYGAGTTGNTIANANLTLSGGTMQAGSWVLSGLGAAGTLRHEYYTTFGAGGSGTYQAGLTSNGNLQAFRDTLTVGGNRLVNADNGVGNYNNALDFPAGSGANSLGDGGDIGNGPGNPFPVAAAAAMPNNDQVAMFHGVLNITTAGLYRFETASDDGSVINIDGTKVADNNFFQGIGTVRGSSIFLSAGQHIFSMAFYEGGGDSGMIGRWNGPDTGNTLVTIDPSTQASSWTALEFGDGLTGGDYTSNPITVTAASKINSYQDTQFSTINLGSNVLTMGGSNSTTGAISFSGTTGGLNIAVGTTVTPASIAAVPGTFNKTGLGTLNLANASALPATTTIKITEGTVNATRKVALNTVGNAVLELNGGTLNLAVDTVFVQNNTLAARFYTRAPGGSFADDPGGSDRLNSILAGPISAGRPLDDRAIAFGPNGGGDDAIGAYFNGIGTGAFSLFYTGFYKPAAAGSINFNLQAIDDNAVVAVDMNSDGIFDQSEILATQNCCGGNVDGIATFPDANARRIAIGVVDTGGGGSIEARFDRLGGVDNIFVNPSTQPGEWGVAKADLSASTLNITANSRLAVNGDWVELGTRTFNNGGLQVDAPLVTYNGLTVNGSSWVGGNGLVRPGVLTASAGATVVKVGRGTLDLTNTANAFGAGSTVSINAGKVIAVANAAGTVNSVGGATINLNGGQFEASGIGTSAVANAFTAKLFMQYHLDVKVESDFQSLLALNPDKSRNLNGALDFGPVYGADAKFRNFFAGQPQGDGRFTALFTTEFTTTGGTFDFGTAANDDSSSVWVDINDDNLVDVGELVDTDTCCDQNDVGTVTLPAGTFKVAYAVTDTGGGSSLVGKFGPTTVSSTIDPSIQAGFSTPDGYNALNMSSTPINVTGTNTLGANKAASAAFGGLTLQSGSQLTVRGPKTTFASAGVAAGTAKIINGTDNRGLPGNSLVVGDTSLPAGTQLNLQGNGFEVSGTVSGTGKISAGLASDVSNAQVTFTKNGTMFSDASSVDAPVQASTITFAPGTGNTATGASFTGGTMAGTLNFSSGTTNISSAVFNNPTASGVEPGVLIEALVNNNSGFDETTPISSSLRTSSMRYGNLFGGDGGTSNYPLDGIWRDNQTMGYKGQIFIPDNAYASSNGNNLTLTDGLGSIAFGENIDDNVLIRINGVDVYRNTQWNDSGTTGELVLPVGFVDIEVRFGEGGGGAGPSGNAGWDRNLAFPAAKGWGIDLNPDDGFDATPANLFGNGHTEGTQAQYTNSLHGELSGIYPIQYRVLASRVGTGIVNVASGTSASVGALTNMTIVNINGGSLAVNGATASTIDLTNANGTGGIAVNGTGAYNTTDMVVAAAATFTKSGTGKLNVTNSFTGGAGSVSTMGGLRLKTLTLAASTVPNPTKLISIPQGGADGLIVINNTVAGGGSGTPGLSLGNNATIDIYDNDIVLYYTPSAGDPNPTTTIQGYINNFYNGATGVPVIASQGIIDTGGQTVFVAIDNGVTGFGDGAVGGTFYDLTLGNSTNSTGFNQTIVRYTWGGDYDLNGVVDALDYAIVDANLGATAPGGVGGWQIGDGDFDGTVTALDYSPIDANLGKGGPLGGAAISAIPEPSTWVLGSLAAVGLSALGLRRRRAAK